MTETAVLACGAGWLRRDSDGVFFTRLNPSLDGLTRDALDFEPTEQRWTEVVRHCGYVASELVVERNARG